MTRVALALACLLLVGGSRCYHPQVLYWCPPPELTDGLWSPTLGADCAQAPAWPYPIHVAIEPGMEQPAGQAIRAWNRWLGHELLVVTPIAEADLVVLYQEHQPGNPLGEAKLLTMGGRLWGVAMHYGTRDPMVIAHELGHLLGLRHDLDRESIMYPWRDGMSAFAAAEARDVQMLRQWYGLR